MVRMYKLQEWNSYDIFLLVVRCQLMGEIYLKNGEIEKAKIQYTQAINVLKSFENDFETSYTHGKYDPEKIKELETGVPIVEVDNPEFIKFVVSSIA